MQSRPADLSDDALGRALAQRWGIKADSVRYFPVGFGSHHWAVRDASGTAWFVTVDEVGDEPESLRAALASTIDLHAAGCPFVVAPLPTEDGEPVALFDGYAIALYPQIDGEHYPSGEFADDDHRRALLDVIVRLHSLPRAAAPRARVDDFAIAHRAEVEMGMADRGDVETGPYAAPTAALLRSEAAALRVVWAEYDALVARVHAERHPSVITHGEPHAANTISTSGGLVLVDWDTVLLAPPERDLWFLEEGDGALLRAYTSATGAVLSPDALSLYRLRWDLRDIAEYVHRFCCEHTGNADDEKSWNGLHATVIRLRGSDPSRGVQLPE